MKRFLALILVLFTCAAMVFLFASCDDEKDKDNTEAPTAAPLPEGVADAALIDEIGEEVFVGAHSMTVTEGLWDEGYFIEHCANGTNYKTGKKGSRLCYLSASFYDSNPGKFTKGKTLAKKLFSGYSLTA